jgi:hypothetical protein
MLRFYKTCLASLLALVTLQTSVSDAKVVRLLDFDGTIVRDQGPYSTWRTYWILQRVDQLHSMMQPVPYLVEAPETLQISYNEYVQFNRYLAKDGMINSLTAVDLEKDPLRPDRPTSFIPGFYQVDDNLTFKYYRPSGKPNKNYLLSDYREAVKRTALLNQNGETRYDWRGPAFALFQGGLARPDSVADTVIFSARWSYQPQVQQLIEEMHKDREVVYAQGVNLDKSKSFVRFHALSAPESLLFGRSGIGSKKVAVLNDEVRQLLWSTSPKHLELAVSGRAAKNGDTGETHTMIVAEDDPRYVDDLRRALENLSSDLYYSANIKFVLFNSGTSENIKSARWKWKYTVFERGIGREALPQEIDFWEGRNGPALQCEQLFVDSRSQK